MEDGVGVGGGEGGRGGRWYQLHEKGGFPRVALWERQQHREDWNWNRAIARQRLKASCFAAGMEPVLRRSVSLTKSYPIFFKKLIVVGDDVVVVVAVLINPAAAYCGNIN